MKSIHTFRRIFVLTSILLATGFPLYGMWRDHLKEHCDLHLPLWDRVGTRRKQEIPLVAITIANFYPCNQIATLKDEISNLRNTLLASEKEKQHVQAQLELLEDRNTQLHNALTSLDTGDRNAQEIIDLAREKDEISRLRNALSEAERNTAEVKAQLESLETNYAELQKKSARITHESKNTQQELQNAHESLREKNIHLGANKESIASLTYNNEKLQSTHNTLNQSIRNYRIAIPILMIGSAALGYVVAQRHMQRVLA